MASALAAVAGVAEPQAKPCLAPAYLDPGASVAEGPHHHPSVAIVLFKRSKSSAVHDVDRILVPPMGLGIEWPAIPRQSKDIIPHYRRLHAHTANGRLHVDDGRNPLLRICHLIALWRRHPAWPNALAGIARWPSAHIRVGDTYRRNVPMAEILHLPLEHDQPVVLFLESPSAL